MSAATPELVERLYRRLLEALSESTAVSPATLTIADLYQHLIPYRGVRMDLGVLELAQYEHALLRLLAGEGGMVRVLEDDARRELVQELTAPNPILGIYRDYAGVGVELRDPPRRPDHRTDAPSAPAASGAPTAPAAPAAPAAPPAPPAPAAKAAAPPPRPAPQPKVELTTPAPAPGDAVRVARADSKPEPRPAPPAPPREADPGASPPPHLFAESDRVAASFPRPAHRDRPAARATAPARPAHCISCREPLPNVDGLRFCPHCGADQSAVACESCGAPIHRGWKFCIRCGARSPAPPTHA
jgi:hypothetical protein